MIGESLKYRDKRWRRLEVIVERAGGPIAREKFNTQHEFFENMIRVSKSRMGLWTGFAFGEYKDSDRLEAVERAAGALKAALDDLNFPAIFAGNILVWKRLDGTETDWEAEKEENWQRYRKFLGAIDHIRMMSRANKAKPRRKRARLARDIFFFNLLQAWSGLGLSVSAGIKSPVVDFIEAASEGVYEFEDPDTARETILNVIRKTRA
jgi:hypothetical protein